MPVVGQAEFVTAFLRRQRESLHRYVSHSVESTVFGVNSLVKAVTVEPVAAAMSFARWGSITRARCTTSSRIARKRGNATRKAGRRR